jgi:pantoate--beta-alanine ligase
MIIFKTSANLKEHLKKLHIKNTSTGFVPTMGALHGGHLALLKKSRQCAEATICSIFINPTQFNNPQDFKNYPVTIEEDIYLLEKNECDILFLPDVNEIYADRNFNCDRFELGYLETVLEGKYRPGHFQGVCQVVKRLLQIVDPTFLFTGQKDYQQCMVLKKLISLLESKAELVVCPTLREEDGLAMSSRNKLLSKDERMLAPAIYQSLLFLKQQIKPADLIQLRKSAEEFLTEKSFKVDYVEFAKAENLMLIDYWNGEDPVIVLTAVYINKIRLIDNLII